MSDLGITQTELAAKSGVSVSNLRQIQHGEDRKRSRSTLAAISRGLGLPEDHLWQVSQQGAVSEGTEQVGQEPAIEALRSELADLRQRVETLETRLDS
jgi:transcriptional regulator with XRE-family HTH domain